MKLTTVLTIISLLGLLIIGIGCLGVQANGSSLNTNSPSKYSMHENQQLNYEIAILSKDRSTNVLKDLKMHVDKVDSENISETFVITVANSLENRFAIKMTNRGNILESNSKKPIIPEVQPELPNLLEFPEKSTNSGTHWTKEFNQSGNYLTSNGTIEYYLTGNSDFTNIGRKKITTMAGTFDCIGIKHVTDYLIKESLISENGTSNSEKYGNFNGENWIDPRNGILIESAFDSHKVISVDLSETTKGAFGFEKMYREVPVDFHMTTKLTNISNI